MSPTVELRLRRLILALLALGLLGVGTELLAIGHFEDRPQVIPLVTVATALTAVAWQAIAASRTSLRVFRVAMMVVIAAGLAGIWLHYRGNMEFQLEINPAQSGWELFSKVLHAKTPPAFAPGVMAQLGLLGLIYTYRHPGSRSSSDSKGELSL